MMRLSGNLIARPVHVLLAGPALDLEGGVANYIRLLLAHLDPALVSVVHVPVGRSSSHSAAWRRPLEYASSAWRFVSILLRTCPDVIHLNPSLNWRSLPLNLFLLLLAKLFTRQPLLIFFRGWNDSVAISMSSNCATGFLLKLALRCADYYLVLAERFRRRLIQAGFPADCIAVSPVMVDTKLLQPSNGHELQDRVTGQSFHVLFLSRLSEDKGVWELADAIDWWYQTHPDVLTIFTIAGAGPDAESLRARFQPAIREDIVRLAGYVRDSEKCRLYQKADLFVFPSRHDEGFPNVIVEALGAGLPIVYTPVGALEEVLGSENGVRIGFSDLSGETLGRKIWDLYQDPVRRQAMAMANRRLAQERYDVKVVCAQMAEIYRRVAELA